MTQSRKRGSKIHGDGITKARGLMRQFADAFTPGVSPRVLAA